MFSIVTAILRKFRRGLATSLALAAFLAVTWAASEPARADDSSAPAPLQVAVTSTPAWPLVGQPVALRADITNSPSKSGPSYRWEMDIEDDWHLVDTRPSFSTLSGSVASVRFRVTVTYGSGASATSAPLAIIWARCLPGPAPEPIAEPVSGEDSGRHDNLALSVSPGESNPSASRDVVAGAFSVTMSAPISGDKPDRPANLAVDVSPGELDISSSWDAAPGASSYKLRWRRPGQGFQRDDQVVVTDTQAIISVSGYGEWVVRVEGCNDAGCGKGASRRARIRQAGPMTPLNFVISAPPGELNLSASWDAVEGASSYKLRWRRAGEDFQADDQVVVTDTQATVSLSGYGEWVARLEACGVSACGQHVSARTRVSPSLPGSPTNLTIAPSSGAPRATASWTASAGSTSYKVRWRRPRGAFQLDDELMVTTPRADFTASDWGQWVVQVEGCNSEGCGVGVSETVNLAAPRPNIVLILADDLGYGEVGAYQDRSLSPAPPDRRISTPRLDRMAAEGMLFTDHYAGAPVCAPSRSVLMTGQHTGHTPIRGNKEAEHGSGCKGDWPIEDDVVTLGEIMRDAGYRTALMGKWGLGGEDSAGLPNDQGFDHFFGYLSQTHANYAYTRNLYRNGEWVPTDGVYSDELIVQEALDYISQESDRPFFLVLSLTAPHANGHMGIMEAPDQGQYADKPGWSKAHKNFAARVTLLDSHVGQMLDKLRELGIDQRTLTIFTSDNGPHNEGRKNTSFFSGSGSLRGIKRDLYEGGIRIPMIAHWPGAISAGGVSGHISGFQDYMPTFAKLGAAETPEGTDGISMHQTLLEAGAQPAHEFLYWEFTTWRGVFKQAVRLGAKWKGVREGSLSAPIGLYDLENDIGERNNVAAQYPDVVERIAELMQSARTESDVFMVE